MKFTLDKKVITLDEIGAAKEYMAEWKFLSSDEIERFAAAIAENEGGHPWNGKLISAGSVEISKDHYDLCVWVNDVVYMDNERIYTISGNISDWYTGAPFGYCVNVYQAGGWHCGTGCQE